MCPTPNNDTPDAATDDADDKEARKTLHVAEITKWAQATRQQRKKDALRRNALRGLERLRARDRALVEGMALIYRAHPCRRCPRPLRSDRRALRQ